LNGDRARRALARARERLRIGVKPHDRNVGVHALDLHQQAAGGTADLEHAVIRLKRCPAR
jgi:hypothetical protein